MSMIEMMDFDTELKWLRNMFRIHVHYLGYCVCPVMQSFSHNVRKTAKNLMIPIS